MGHSLAAEYLQGGGKYVCVHVHICVHFVKYCLPCGTIDFGNWVLAGHP